MSEEDEFTKLLASAQSGTSLESLIPTDLSGEDAIRPGEDAMDFEGEDELAEDELPDEEPAGGDGNGDEAKADDDDNWLDDLGIEDVREDTTVNTESGIDKVGAKTQDSVLQTVAPPKSKESKPDVEPTKEDVMLQIYFPRFLPREILRMNDFFGPKPAFYSAMEPRQIRPCIPSRLRLDAENDQRQNFRAASSRAARAEGVVTISTDETTGRDESVDQRREHDDALEEELPMATADWDYLLESDGEADGVSPSTNSESDEAIRSPQRQVAPMTSDLQLAKRPRLEVDLSTLYDSDVEDALLEGRYTIDPSAKVEVDMNDPFLLFAESRSEPRKQAAIQNRYNISNDKSYDMLKENYQKKVRSTIGNLAIDHSMVAARLQSPFYKVMLAKSQMRSWHRHKLNLKPGTEFTLTAIKPRKKKKDKQKTIQQLLAKTTDLSLGDNAPIFMVEYSEESPLVLSNVGMGSKLINYYRKRNAEDTARPKLPLGETHVLDVQDRSAFWNFGFVEPGNVVPTLYNQMIRAPVFRHEPRKTDFLLTKSANKSRGQRYYLRELPFTFVAGQTFPVTHIPGPHSRKVTTASKNRLKMIVYRVLNKDPHQRLQVRDISGHFPDQNDMQNRQRLKEFMEYQRSGDDQGFWKVKNGDILPDENHIREMIKPEDIALLEAMQVGQQHLEDSGYSRTVEDDKDNEGGTLEEQLAPWNLSRNFINAIQGKAMLQLHGQGDPTARGEGFSFLRTSMKGGFKAANEGAEKVDKSKLGGHSYNVALQQKAYDEEIKRIWYAQADSLRVTDPKRLPAEAPKQLPAESQSPIVDPTADESGQKILKITRLLEDENGVKIRKTEIVTDPNVVRAYLTRRRAYEDSQTAARDIVVTNDEDRNRRNKRILEEELARLRRNQDRRMARKATKGDTNSGKVKSTTRKCATCGAVGHIKTNKSCPMYNDIYMGGQPGAGSTVAPVAPSLP